MFLPSILSADFRGTFRGNFGARLEGGSGGGKNGHFADTPKIGRFRGGLGERVHTHAETARSALRCLLDALVAFFRDTPNFWRILRAPTSTFTLFCPPKHPSAEGGKIGGKTGGKLGVRKGTIFSRRVAEFAESV